jgi:ABC-2 type transport system permease protein
MTTFTWRDDARLLRTQVATEQLEHWTSGARAYFSFALPAGLLALLGTVNSDELVDVEGVGVRYRDFLVPGLVGFAVVVGTFVAISANLTLLREAGVLKRLRGTPLPLPLLLGAKMLSAIANVLVMATTVVVVGVVGFGTAWRPAALPALAVAVVLGGICFALLGVAATSLMATSESSIVVANALVLPIAFVSGVFSPAPEGVVGDVAGLLPLEPVVALARAAFVEEGAAPLLPVDDLAVLAAWTAVAAVAAWRLVSWEPTRK